MALHRSGSPLIQCLILLLGIAFLAPLYHDHADDHDSDVHPLLHDASTHENLSSDEQHAGTHLHIKKDIGRTDTRLRFTGRLLNPDLSAVIAPPAFALTLTCQRPEFPQTPVFLSRSSDCLSGLSPPLA